MKDEHILHVFEEDCAMWGKSTSIDMYGCDIGLMNDAKQIRRFVRELCRKIGMRRYGKCHVVYFGEDERVQGYSMFQLIETSNISAHFANASKAIYLDIFSCKDYDVDIVVDYACCFFKAECSNTTTVIRK